jgi:hypothetical protein
LSGRNWVKPPWHAPWSMWPSWRELTGTGLAAGTIGDLEKGYAGFGWKVDDSAIRAFAGIESPADLEAVKSAVRSVYLPWLEESARYFQKLVCDTSYPGGLCLTARGKMYGSGECVLFVDGLRFDAAKRLAGLLSASGVMVAEEHVWAALPSVTATGKPAVSPVACKIRGEDVSPEFEPVVGDTGQPLKGAYHLKKLLTEAGWTLLDSSAGGDGKGMAWCELGDIDSERARSWMETGQAYRCHSIGDQGSSHGTSGSRLETCSHCHRSRLAAPSGRPAEGRASGRSHGE